MWNWVHLSARIFLCVVGAFCLVTAIFLYTGEEGRTQSALEDLWTRIDDRHKRVLSAHTAFMQQVARLETRYLDALFGHRLFSLRSVGVSLSFSVSSAALSFCIFSILSNASL